MQRLGLISEEENIVNTKINSTNISPQQTLLSNPINYKSKKTGNIELTVIGKHFIEACFLEE